MKKTRRNFTASSFFSVELNTVCWDSFRAGCTFSALTTLDSIFSALMLSAATSFPAYLRRRHILPETYSVLLTQAAILIPQYVLAEMTLSFLGLGVPEPVPSWGNLLSSLQQYSVLVSPWWMYLPALVMVPFFLGYLGLASALQQRGEAYKIAGRSLGSLM